MQTTLKINPSLQQKLAAAQFKAEGLLKEKLEAIADYTVSISPVDTGAYIESFSILPAGSSGGRMKNSETSARKSRSVKNNTASRQDFVTKATENLLTDINALDLKTTDRVVLRNRATHAQDVEEKWGYHIFARVKRVNF
jgi:hypothetical protein